MNFEKNSKIILLAQTELFFGKKNILLALESN